MAGRDFNFFLSALSKEIGSAADILRLSNCPTEKPAEVECVCGAF